MLCFRHNTLTLEARALVVVKLREAARLIGEIPPPPPSTGSDCGFANHYSEEFVTELADALDRGCGLAYWSQYPHLMKKPA
jgi:hypothetical protein